jgi:hypothetical protein
VAVPLIYSSDNKRDRRQCLRVYKEAGFYVVQPLYTLDNYIDLSFYYL